MTDDEYKEDDVAIYQDRPPTMSIGYLDIKMEIPRIRKLTSRGAHIVTLQAFVSGTAMLGSLKDPLTGAWKYDYDKEPMKGLFAELSKIKVPQIIVKVEPKYTRISITGVGEWHITKSTEEGMMKMIEDERYDVPLLKSTALLTKVEMLLYREGILDPIENMESQAEIRWLGDALQFDIDTIDLGVDDVQE